MFCITLVRHGRPTVSLMEWVSGRSLLQFIDRYNAAGISDDSVPKPATLKAIASATQVFTSDYIRAQESALKLKLDIDSSQKQYREVDCWVNFPIDIPFPAWIWVIVTRILWPLNQITGAESFAMAQKRAQVCAQELSTQTQDHHIVLVGHGGMNTLIARELLELGWDGPKQPKLNHWGATSYYKESL